jgi:hypothetical protein
VLDSVIDGVTGIFFKEQNKESLKEAIIKFKDMKFDKNAIRKHAETFDIGVFKQRIYNFVVEKYNEFKGN